MPFCAQLPQPLSESFSTYSNLYEPLTDDMLVATFKGACDVEDPLIERIGARRQRSLQLPCPETPTAFNISAGEEQATFPSNNIYPRIVFLHQLLSLPALPILANSASSTAMFNSLLYQNIHPLHASRDVPHVLIFLYVLEW